MDSVNYYFGGGAAAMNLHERLADLLLMELSFSMEDPGIASQPTHAHKTVMKTLTAVCSMVPNCQFGVHNFKAYDKSLALLACTCRAPLPFMLSLYD